MHHHKCLADYYYFHLQKGDIIHSYIKFRSLFILPRHLDNLFYSHIVGFNILFEHF